MENAEQTIPEIIFEELENIRLLNAPPVAEEEVKAGRRIADHIYSAMRVSGLRVQDAGVLLVCMAKGGKLEQLAYAREDTEASDTILLEQIAEASLQPVGIVVAILDRMRGGILRRHAEVFEGCEHSLHLIRQAFAIIEARHKSGGPLLN